MLIVGMTPVRRALLANGVCAADRAKVPNIVDALPPLGAANLGR